MNVFKIEIAGEPTADRLLDRWLVCWLAFDLTGEPAPPWNVEGGGAEAAREALLRLYRRVAYDPALGMSSVHQLAAFYDRCCVSFCRLQSLIGSLGQDHDEQLFQWLTQQGD